jgi:hypothetical protein
MASVGIAMILVTIVVMVVVVLAVLTMVVHEVCLLPQEEVVAFASTHTARFPVCMTPCPCAIAMIADNMPPVTNTAIHPCIELL